MNDNERRALTLLAGAGLGAAILYFLDPRQGARRRAVVHDQTWKLIHTGRHTSGKVARDVRNRVRGLTARTRSKLHHDPPTDEQLVDRVRSRMGRFISHPRGIEVTAHEGVVELHGPIAFTEKENALWAIRRVRGVREVVDRLDASVEDGSDAGAVPRFAEEGWAPAPRVLAGTLGSMLLAYGLTRRGFMRGSAALFGAGLLARAVGNASLSRAIGLRRG